MRHLINIYFIFNLFLCANYAFAMDAIGCIQGYKEIEKIGSGSFGVVWKANESGNPNNIVAVKIFQVKDSKYNKSEIEILKKLSEKPSIKRIPKYIESNDCSIVMEFVPGISAEEYKIRSGVMSEEDATKFLKKCLETLGAIHRRGVFHRDIKPANIIIHQETGDPWIVDFGIAKESMYTKEGNNTAIGTSMYKAPEIDSGTVGEYSDIYSLGATTVALIGDLSEADTSWSDVVSKSDLSETLKSVLNKMIEYYSVNRYQNCDEICEVLNHENTLTNTIFDQLGYDLNIVQNNILPINTNREINYFKLLTTLTATITATIPSAYFLNNYFAWNICSYSYYVYPTCQDITPITYFLRAIGI